MPKSVKLKNDNYWDSSCIVHNRQKLSDIIYTYLYDNQITPTNEFLGDKRIYQKRLYTYTSVNNGEITIPHGLDANKLEYAWIDTSNSFFFTKSEGYLRSCPICMNHYTTASSTDSISATFDSENVIIMTNGGWSTGWFKVVTIKFTYID